MLKAWRVKALQERLQKLVNKLNLQVAETVSAGPSRWYPAILTASC